MAKVAKASRQLINGQEPTVRVDGVESRCADGAGDATGDRVNGLFLPAKPVCVASIEQDVPSGIRRSGGGVKQATEAGTRRREVPDSRGVSVSYTHLRAHETVL